MFLINSAKYQANIMLHLKNMSEKVVNYSKIVYTGYSVYCTWISFL